ncbi:hypothetical protein N3K66_007210 [Trichothecium roseum]|uniref:Uncharacterized protein n=1 Tax=Trichothecium roseum TaxID=47278 RepID=A0ACC0UV04_9HYPO|nr:hypothetical protein N3K66_007210 [Trichothecium roseum]
MAPSPRKIENPILGSVIEADERTCLEADTLKRVTSTEQATADSPDTTTRNSKAQPFSCGYSPLGHLSGHDKALYRDQSVLQPDSEIC